jgi:homoserine O-acetyltransferase
MAKKEMPESTVGLVHYENFYFGDRDEDLLHLDCGKTLRGVTIRYETYGKLNADKSNAILIEHALTGDAHLAGKYTPEDKKPGWWDAQVGPGRPFDTEKYFIICSNILGGCSGSTGPSSINPETGKPYNMDFPVITIADMVRAQKRLIDHLGITKLMCVVGGSMGGMLACQWPVLYPEMVGSVAAIATAIQITAQSIAFNWVGREAIMADQDWDNGNYEEQPHKGLAIARMLAHITYLSDESMSSKFGRALQSTEDYSFNFKSDFRVESYLNYQGTSFVERFDANSYLYITRAFDYFDVSVPYGGDYRKAYEKVKCPFLVVSFSSDWLFPEYQSRNMARMLLENGNDVTFCNIQSSYGHDAFLLEFETLGKLLHGFLTNIAREGGLPV